MDRRITLLKNPFFLTSTLLYFLVHLHRATGYFLPTIVNNYLTDILCMPIVLVISTTAVRVLRNKPSFWPSTEMVLSLGLVFAFFFELILPNISVQYTADSIDVIAYFLGIIGYYLLIDRGRIKIIGEN